MFQQVVKCQNKSVCNCLWMKMIQLSMHFPVGNLSVWKHSTAETSNVENVAHIENGFLITINKVAKNIIQKTWMLANLCYALNIFGIYSHYHFTFRDWSPGIKIWLVKKAWAPFFKLYLISASTQDVRPYSAAECIAVHPSAVLELTSAPCLRRASKHARCPYSAAWWRGTWRI